MKEANRKMMEAIAKKLFPDVPHDKAMAMLKKHDYPNNAFVRMNSGRYSVMDKYYKLID